MLSHDNMLFGQSACVVEIVNNTPAEIIGEPHEQVQLSYLPLSHVAAMQVDIINNIITGS